MFTGQRYDGADLMDYDARQYEMVHGQFLQPDSIIPNVMNPQSWNRYAYTLNNPVRYTDPTGHMLDEPDDAGGDNNGGGGFVDDRPYCEKFPYASGCDAPTPPTDNGSNQNPDTNGGDSCWPRCNRDDEADAQAQAASSEKTQQASGKTKAPTGKPPGNAFPQSQGGCGITDPSNMCKAERWSKYLTASGDQEILLGAGMMAAGGIICAFPPACAIGVAVFVSGALVTGAGAFDKSEAADYANCATNGWCSELFETVPDPPRAGQAGVIHEYPPSGLWDAVKERLSTLENWRGSPLYDY